MKFKPPTGWLSNPTCQCLHTAQLPGPPGGTTGLCADTHTNGGERRHAHLDPKVRVRVGKWVGSRERRWHLWVAGSSSVGTRGMNLPCTQCDTRTIILRATWRGEATASGTHLQLNQLGSKKASHDWSHWLVTVWDLGCGSRNGPSWGRHLAVPHSELCLRRAVLMHVKSPWSK